MCKRSNKGKAVQLVILFVVFGTTINNNTEKTYLGRELSYSYCNYACRIEILIGSVVMKMIQRGSEITSRHDENQSGGL